MGEVAGDAWQGQKYMNKIRDNHIHYTSIHYMLAFLDCHTPIDGNPLVLYLILNLNLLYYNYVCGNMLVGGGG